MNYSISYTNAHAYITILKLYNGSTKLVNVSWRSGSNSDSKSAFFAEITTSEESVNLNGIHFISVGV